MDPVTLAALSELAKNFKEKTSENIKKGFEDLRHVADNQTLTELGTALNLAAIAAPALKSVFGEINSETMPYRVEAMKSLLDKMKDPDVKLMLDHIESFIIWFLVQIPKLIGYLDDIARAFNDVITAVQGVSTRWNTPTASGKSQFNLDIAKLLGGFWMNDDEEES